MTRDVETQTQGSALSAPQGLHMSLTCSHMPLHHSPPNRHTTCLRPMAEEGKGAYTIFRLSARLDAVFGLRTYSRFWLAKPRVLNFLLCIINWPSLPFSLTLHALGLSMHLSLAPRCGKEILESLNVKFSYPRDRMK